MPNMVATRAKNFETVFSGGFGAERSEAPAALNEIISHQTQKKIKNK
jgi:hypothetical protein